MTLLVTGAAGFIGSHVAMALLDPRVDGADRPDRAGYLLIFEIISVHLLVVLVGAAYLARAKRKGNLVLE